MKFCLKRVWSFSFAFVLFSNANYTLADTTSDTEILLNWAQNAYPELFPSAQGTQTLDPWIYRYYPETGIYAGVNTGDLGAYVLGGPFGDSPTYVDSLTNLISQIDDASSPTGNQKPSAENISIISDLTTPFIQVQLIGTDPDNDSISYVLDSTFEGTGYSYAYIESNSGILYAELRNDGVSQIGLNYRVSDGLEFSDPASVTISVGEVEDGVLGREDIPADEYSRIDLAFFEGELLGGNPGDDQTLPSSIDLSGLFPSAGNQGQQNSCVGWATAYALKSYQEKVEEQWDFSESTVFSPAWIYNQINGSADRGSRIDHALQLVIDQGAATLQSMPYNPNEYLSQPSSTVRAEAANYKGESYQRISGVQQLKSALVNRRPVVVGIIVYPSLSNLYGANSVYNDFSGNDQGGHAVTVVGYDDTKFGGSFKIINSWGLGWGDNGYFWLPYDAVSDVMIQSFVLTDAPNSSEPPDVPVTPVQDNLPNLDILDWNATYFPQSGGTGKFYWEIINSGTTTAFSGADINLMLSKDRNIDSSDWYIVYETISFDIEPGGTVYRDESNHMPFKFPETLPAGSYYMAVWLDDLQAIQESNESDNISFGTDVISISSPELPDLAIDYWWANWDGLGNGVLEYTVINNGTASTTTADSYINLVLSEFPDPSTGASHFIFYEKTGTVLAPGGTVYRDSLNPAYFTLGQAQEGYTVPAGTYYMSLWVDDLNVEDESNEINNISVGNNTISLNSAALAQNSAQGTESNENERVNFNGKSINKSQIIGKVTISKNLEGKRVATFHKVSQSNLAGMDTDSESTKQYDKVMKAANEKIFPKSSRLKMPDANTSVQSK